MVSREAVWLCALDSMIGSEIRKTRPCRVVSPDELNGRLRTAVIAPMTTGSRPAAFRVAVRFRGKDGLVLPDQLHTIDQSRLAKRLGRAGQDTADEVLRVLREMFTP